MLYAIADAKYPVKYLYGGNLVNDNQFIHMKRILDSFVFISVLQGHLYINTNSRDYDIGPNEFVILFPDKCHYGYRPTEGKLSYYWTHFYITDPVYVTKNHSEEQSLISLYESEGHDKQYYILPETGELSDSCRTNLLFVQLLDISKRGGFRTSHQCDYALSTLLLELSNDVFLKRTIKLKHSKISPTIADIMEWIQANYDADLTVSEVASKFGYHPSYITAIFKKATGYTLIEYINIQRIKAAQNLLTTTPKLPIEKISEMVGYRDEKYFMKLFKRYEGVTPTGYRKAFYQKRINKA